MLQAKKFLKIHKKILCRHVVIKLQDAKCEHFTRKHLCYSFILNKVAGWRHNIKIKSLTPLFFHCVTYKKIQAFCTIYAVSSYSLLESLVIVCILPISYLMSGARLVPCEKSLEIKQAHRSNNLW